MIAIFAFVNMERSLEMMIVLGDFGGNFSFVSGVVDDFLDFANPTAFRLVFVGLHSLYYNTYSYLMMFLKLNVLLPLQITSK